MSLFKIKINPRYLSSSLDCLVLRLLLGQLGYIFLALSGLIKICVAHLSSIFSLLKCSQMQNINQAE